MQVTSSRSSNSAIHKLPRPINTHSTRFFVLQRPIRLQRPEPPPPPPVDEKFYVQKFQISGPVKIRHIRRLQRTPSERIIHMEPRPPINPVRTHIPIPLIKGLRQAGFTETKEKVQTDFCGSKIRNTTGKTYMDLSSISLSLANHNKMLLQ
jgi:hypothetical protein